MGRIEDAIAKLQSQRNDPAQSQVVGDDMPRPLGRVIEAKLPAVQIGHAHVYGGRHIEIDFAALRANELLAPDKEERRIADQYRTAKRPLLRNAAGAAGAQIPRGNLLMVASALAGEGKTFTALNLCLSIAREQDWTVVLVDGDCNKPHLSRLFGAEDSPGFMDLLRDPRITFDSLVMPTSISGFAVLPAGKRDEHAAERLASARMDAVCTEISAAAPRRLIVFDSSPLLLTPESPALAAHVGQVVLVVLANKTPRRAVLSARERLDSNAALNLLLNQAGTQDTGVLYGEYYGFAE